MIVMITMKCTDCVKNLIVLFDFADNLIIRAAEKAFLFELELAAKPSGFASYCWFTNQLHDKWSDLHNTMSAGNNKQITHKKPFRAGMWKCELISFFAIQKMNDAVTVQRRYGVRAGKSRAKQNRAINHHACASIDSIECRHWRMV